ncbi:hypothetical protein J6590_014264 [Homalodisca vitripennis]|nr:hypothetical protein J6590_014264 [Homalodisca vitripennis]
MSLSGYFSAKQVACLVDTGLTKPIEILMYFCKERTVPSRKCNDVTGSADRLSQHPNLATSARTRDRDTLLKYIHWSLCLNLNVSFPRVTLTLRHSDRRAAAPEIPQQCGHLANANPHQCTISLVQSTEHKDFLTPGQRTQLPSASCQSLGLISLYYNGAHFLHIYTRLKNAVIVKIHDRFSISVLPFRSRSSLLPRANFHSTSPYGYSLHILPFRLYLDIERVKTLRI